MKIPPAQKTSPVVGLITLASLLISLTPILPTKSFQGKASIKKQTPSSTRQIAEAKARDDYGKLPLSFEVNRGQTDSRVVFLSRGNGLNVFLTPDESASLGRVTKPSVSCSAIQT